MRHATSGRRGDKTTPRRTARQLVVVGLTILMMAVGVSAAFAHYQSGYLSGCVSATYVDFHQNTPEGWVYNYLDDKGRIWRKDFGHGDVHWRRGGYWGGNEWAVGGDHPSNGTASAHCGG